MPILTNCCRVLATALLLSVAVPSSGAAQSRTDSLAVVATVQTFHQALAQGDSTAALALLAPDATVLESGEIETRAEYRSHHLAADISFTRAVPGSTGPIAVVIHNDAAWATSTSITVGKFDGRAIDSQGAELMVLSRTAGLWQIRAIHWSSHARRPR
ncbi:MAG: nuclear transport factor 2 family protein [Gemmatimonadota bacterium]|nr:nuclear transport factor 2 family protein [Gemmatimonadota bacterium]